MKRPILKLLIALLSMLAILAGVFWWRRSTTFEVYFVSTHAGVLWEFSSGQAIGIVRVTQWPGPIRHWYAGYNCRDGSDMSPGAMPCFTGGWNNSSKLWGAEFDYGVVRSPIHPNGEIWLGPDWPNEGRVDSWTLSHPMPFRSVSMPHGMAFGLLIAPAIMTLTSVAYRSLRTRRRIRRSLCAGCAYDLRATTGRCPECGTDVPRNRDANERPI